MKTILHVKASPRGEASFSTRLAASFLEALLARRTEAEVDTLDVFVGAAAFAGPAAEAKYAVLAGGEPADDAARAWKEVVATVERLKAAGLLVVSCGMWNFSVPYPLKQWIDVVVQPGLTFNYTDEGPEGLLKGLPAVLLLARGGDYSGDMADLDMQGPYLRAILGFMGIGPIESVVVEPTVAAGPDVAREKLAAATGAAGDLAGRL